MKHWIILCFALLVMALCVSCGAKCDGYAPSNVNVSWSEYNSVDAVLIFSNIAIPPNNTLKILYV